MNSSFYNGISGVQTHQYGLDTWANNISNISTIGYKSTTPEFSNFFATSLSESFATESTANNIGNGSHASGTKLDMKQGIFQSAENTFDIALNGEGWFGMTHNNNIVYTRAGAFNIDVNGNMVDPNGNYLLGTTAENINPVTLPQEKIEKIGSYYRKDIRELGTPYSVVGIDNVELNEVNTQNKINLPDLLYYPPEATTNINYQANLNPKINLTDIHTTLSSSDLTYTINNIDKNINLSGTVENALNLTNPKEGDIVNIFVSDANNKVIEVKASLDSSLSFNINNADISSLDMSTIKVNQEIRLDQEIPNVEHFTTEVISPEGNKNFLDMTFTKKVPQSSLETVWDTEIQLLSYHEDYRIQTYDPTKYYDETIYNIDLGNNQVTKIYDPSIYKVDKGSNKVYEIIDEQSGNAKFSGAGELIESNMPTLSNGGVPLDVNIGTPYEQISVANPIFRIENEQIIFEGNSPELSEGKQVNIKFTDPDGFERTASGKVEADGSWMAIQKYTSTDPTSATITDVSAYHVVHNGYDGMISNVDLDKARQSNADGKVEGFLTDYDMDINGNVIAQFSNGENSAIAKIAVYHFQNDQGLSMVGSTMFQESVNSGKPIFYTDANGNFKENTQILTHKLESSNVDFSTALTELIIMQKAFDSSAKSITTSDELIQNAINMKR